MCLNSLVSLQYPIHLLEVIVVDDLSTDRTAEIVKTYTERYPHIRQVSSSAEERNLVGKVRALCAGITAASGEVIFVTDADCIVQPEWITEIVGHFDRPDVGIVAGFTSITGTSMFSRVQALDWFTLVSFASASARLGIPSTAVGNNLAFRRSAYDKVGGYARIPFSVTEDLALVRAVVSQTEYKLAFSSSKESMIGSEPCTTWKEWYRQRTRWFVGGKAMPPVSKSIFLLGYLTNASLIYLLLSGSWLLATILLGTKILLETILVLPVLSHASRVSLLRILPLYQIYFMLYVLALPILTAFRRTVSWKGRTLEES